jgi:hypothetical protein
MDQFITWYCSEPRLALNRAVVLRFRLYLESLGLTAGTVNQRLAAVRRLAYEAADSGLLSPELAGGNSQGQRSEAAWIPHGELADTGPSSTLAGAGRRRRPAQCPRPRNAFRARWMRIATGRTLRPHGRGSTDQARALGHCGLGWQRRSRPDCSDARLGQGCSRSMEGVSKGNCGPNLPRC